MRHTVSLVEASYERKDRVRGGEVQRRKKVSSKDGYKMSDGKSTRMSNKERRNRSRSQKKGARKRKSSQARSSRRRKVSMRKRKSRLGEALSEGVNNYSVSFKLKGRTFTRSIMATDEIKAAKNAIFSVIRNETGKSPNYSEIDKAITSKNDFDKWGIKVKRED